jgi:hypothetical protein
MPVMERTFRVAVSAVAGAFLAAIAGIASASAQSREPPPWGDHGSSFWSVVSVRGSPDDDDAILHFEVQSLSLDVRCYRRSWAHDATAMRFPNAYGSNARCGPEPPPLVEAFDRLMPTVSRVSAAKDELKLLDVDGNAVLAAERLRSSGLENRDWIVVEYFDGRSLVRTERRRFHPGSWPIVFMHGSLHGSPGCGALVGGYTMIGLRMTIEAGAILTGNCTIRDERGVSIDMFRAGFPLVEALNRVRSIKREDARFLLLDTNGRTQLVLAPMDNSKPPA